MVDQQELHENGWPNKQSPFADYHHSTTTTTTNNNNNNNNNSCPSWGERQQVPSFCQTVYSI